MTRVVAARRGAGLFLLCLLLSGCFPATDNQLDEKKDPHFLEGKKLLQQRDYQGAIGAFEEAVDANSRSASAHFELGLLYEDKVTNSAAAIYHYDRYLQYSVNQDQSDFVRQHINNCKLELAKGVATTGTLAPAAQREYERVLMENRDLQARIAALQTQLDQAKSVASARPYIPPAEPDSAAAHPVPTIIHEGSRHMETPRVVSSTSSGLASSRPVTPVSTRSHIVKKGETPIGIAKNYGISLNALLAANPQLKPSHMTVGQTLRIPSS